MLEFALIMQFSVYFLLNVHAVLVVVLYYKVLPVTYYFLKLVSNCNEHFGFKVTKYNVICIHLYTVFKKLDSVIE